MAKSILHWLDKDKKVLSKSDKTFFIKKEFDKKAKFVIIWLGENMKILHTADIHLGVKNLKLSVDKQSIMKEEMNLQIQNLFLKAKEEGFDVVLICGDLFHNKSVTNKVKNNFYSSVKSYGRPVIYINGNHDEFSIDNYPENFIYLNRENPLFEYEGVQFFDGIDFEFIKGKFDKNKKNILLLHGNIENNADNDYIDISKFKQLNFDYVAMGHIHEYKQYSFKDVPYVYSGSLFSNGFDECGDKGYVEVNLTDEVNFQFKPQSKRRFLEIYCDITNAKTYGDITKMISNSLQEAGAKKTDIIRVVLTGYYEEEMDKNLFLVEEQFEDCFYFELQDKTRLKIDVERYKQEKLSLKAEFINLVENSSESEDDKNTICKLGIEALKGEELSIWNS